MPPAYRIIEVFIYSLLNFLPFLALALYPFRHSLRFSVRITCVLGTTITVIQLILGYWAAFFSGGNTGLISAFSTVLYAAFYFLAVKKHFGKTLFSLLMISNLANLTVVAAKCIEGQLFPDLAMQPYRWSFSLFMLLVEAAIGVPLFFYIKKVYTPAVDREPSGFEWRFLWLIPATFYLMWYYAFYGNISRTSLEIALRPKNALFLFIVNTGAILIYYVVSCLILEQNKTVELQESNHLLTMQALQYENLQERITEARRAKHDVRHHIALIREYLNNEDYTALSEYLDQYGRSVPDDTDFQFCDNSAANAVLLYFAQQAKSDGIDYIVRAAIPETTFVDETDLSVVFGNLLENALDACRSETGRDRKIVVRSSQENNSLCITVDNTFSGTLKSSKKGLLASTKHPGTGLGTESVKAIAEKYNGICRFEAKDGMFYSSVICFAEK